MNWTLICAKCAESLISSFLVKKWGLLCNGFYLPKAFVDSHYSSWRFWWYDGLDLDSTTQSRHDCREQSVQCVVFLEAELRMTVPVHWCLPSGHCPGCIKGNWETSQKSPQRSLSFPEQSMIQTASFQEENRALKSFLPSLLKLFFFHIRVYALWLLHWRAVMWPAGYVEMGVQNLAVTATLGYGSAQGPELWPMSLCAPLCINILWGTV